MNIYDLKFSDGTSCRMLDPEAQSLEAIIAAQEGQFGGRLTGVHRIIPPIPDKLPWKRCGENEWRLANFTLIRDGDGFQVSWPSGSARGGRDEISAAVRDNWSLGC